MYKCLSNSFRNKLVLQEEIWGNYDYNLINYLKISSNLKNKSIVSKIKALKRKISYFLSSWK